MLSIPGYHLTKLLQENARTYTYRGVHIEDANPVMVKVSKSPAPRAEDSALLQHEYAIITSLDVDGILKAYRLEHFEDGVALILENFDGLPLSEYIATEKLSLRLSLRIVLKFIDFLDKIHDQGVILKWISPASIFINPTLEIIKLTNFELSDYKTKESSELSISKITEDVLPYIAPEQTGRMSRTVDHRSDYYSLGVTLYELLTRTTPFPYANPIEIIHGHLAKTAVSPSDLDANLPRQISRLVLKLLAKTPEDRYQNLHSLKSDLEYCLEQLEKNGRINNFPLALADISTDLGAPQKMIGREEQIEQLRKTWDKVTSGSSEVTLISGYSGIGKTTLLNEIRRSVVGEQGLLLTGKFDELKNGQPYSAIIEMLRRLVLSILSADDELLSFWRLRLQQHLRLFGQVVVDVIPELELVIGPQVYVSTLTLSEARARFTLAFQAFLQALGSRERPLVMVLDDLQWIDDASSQFLSLLIKAAATNYTWFILTYRSNELHSNQFGVQLLRDIKNASLPIEEIQLRPLSLESISQLVTGVLHRTPADSQLLTELIFSKTGGNPYFAIEFLRKLYRDGFLSFDNKQRRWLWDLEKIYQLDVADNVAELIKEKVRELRQETKQVLKIAACFGSRFEFRMVAAISDATERSLRAALDEAVHRNLIQHLSPEDELQFEKKTSFAVENGKYKFSHDQVLQAVYSLIADDEFVWLHLKIGRLFLRSASTNEIEVRAVDIVAHLNLGQKAMNEEDELTQLAELNLQVGQRTKRAAAYSSSLKYFRTGLSILQAKGWDQHYTLMLTLHIEAAESAYMSAELQFIEELYAAVLANARNLLDRVRIYEVKIQNLIGQNRLPEAIDTALFVLRQLGVRVPKNISWSRVFFELFTTKAKLWNKTIESISTAPEMREAEDRAAMRVIRTIHSAAYLTQPRLFPLLIFRQISLLIRKGNVPESAATFAGYGILLGMTGKTEESYPYGMLALQLLERYEARELKARLLMAVNTYCRPWKEHLRNSLEPFQAGSQCGMETGDIEFVSHLANIYIITLYVCGARLADVEEELKVQTKKIGDLKQHRSVFVLKLFHQLVINLRGGRVDPWILSGEVYHEQKMVEVHREAKDVNALCHLFLCKMILNYHFGHYADAVMASREVEKYLEGYSGMFMLAIFRFYQSLIFLGWYKQGRNEEQKRALGKVAKNQKAMKRWAHHAPMNYLHKFYLVEAERAQVLGRDSEAREFYDKAITLAHENEYLNEEALAYELAGRFHLDRGQAHPARYYLRDAHYAYLRWGALAKVKDLETRYPQIFPSTAIAEQPLSTAFDAQSILKASQALTGEIVLEKLLARLMRIVLENAGAQRGVLLFVRNGRLIIEAEGRSEQEDVPVLHSVPVETRDDLPISLLRYVGRTKEQIVLNNAAESPTFAADPYLVNNRPKSILCTPLIKQDQLTGILYLENNLTIGVFTPDKLEVVNVLATEAAISIENARLYRSLEEANEQLADYSKTLEVKVEERTQDLQQKNQELEEASQQVNEANRRKSRFLAGMSHQLRTPMNAILGFTRLVLRRAGDILPERQRDNLVKVRESAENLLSLINQLLDLSKIEAGRMEIHPSLFDVKKFVVGCVDTVAPLVKPGVLLRSEAIDGIDNANTDEDGLRQIMLNLLSNAVKFTEVGEVVVRVSREERENSETWLVISVLDTGPGIAADALERIFDEFEQLGQSNLHGEKRGPWLATGARRLTDLQEGTGLGLPIAQRWAELLGGSISVQSELGKGSTFTVSIPMIYRTSQGALVENRVL